MTAIDETGFYASFLLEIGQLYPHFGATSSLNYPENQITLEKMEKNPLENICKNPMETAPRNCRFLSLVVVKRVLSIICLVFFPTS